VGVEKQSNPYVRG